MASNNTKALQQLLLWARKEKIVLSSVSMGGVTITVERDYNLQPPAGAQTPAEQKRGIYEQFAGPLAPMLRGEQPTGAATNEPTEEDE
jgi:hypothetical protein